MTFHEFRANSRPLKSNIMVLVLFFICSFVPAIMFFIRLTEKKISYKKIHGGWLVFYFIVAFAMTALFISVGFDRVQEGKDTILSAAVMISIICLPYVLTWLFALIYNFRVERFLNERAEMGRKVDHCFSLVRGGMHAIEELARELELSEQETVYIVLHFIHSNRLQDYYFEPHSKALVAVGASRKKNQVNWKCGGCGANNNLWIYEGEEAVCEYCGFSSGG